MPNTVTVVVRLILTVSLVAACGSGGGPSSHADGGLGTEGDGGAARDSGSSSDGGSGSIDPATLPGFVWETHRVADPAESTACSGVLNDTAVIDGVQVGQTHLMAPTWPLFFTIADRPALLRIHVSGDGPAPEVRVTVSRDGSEVGSRCATGPATLPGDFDVVLPAAYVQPGTSLVVESGGANLTVSEAELNIGPDPSFRLVTFDFVLFGNAPREFPADTYDEMARTWPVARLYHSPFPRALALDGVWLKPKDRSTAPDGSAAGPHGPLLATEKAHCRSGDRANGTCTAYNNYEIMASMGAIGKVLLRANGIVAANGWAGAPSLGGGLGGGTVASGSNTQGTLQHELGHSMGMPHWGDRTGDRGSARTRFPYWGTYLNDAGQPLGGGTGPTPAIETDFAVLPTYCEVDMAQRQDPMQRHGDNHCQGSIDNWSDFSARWIFQHLVGGPTVTGTVTEGGVDLPFAIDGHDGRPHWTGPGTGTYNRWDNSVGAWVDVTADLSLPEQEDVPVYTLYGVATMDMGAFYEPLLYRGNLLRLVDWNDAADLEWQKTVSTACHRGCDLALRVEREGGERHDYRIQGLLRAADDWLPWALNVPAEGGPITRLTLLYKPIATNSGGPNDIVANDVSAGHVLDGAQVLATWSPR